MNKQYDNSNRGVLFKNDRKTTDNQPDYKGNATVEGVYCDVGAWIKDSSKGGKYMSLSFTPKEQTQQTSQVQAVAKPPPKQAATLQEMDDDIPF